MKNILHLILLIIVTISINCFANGDKAKQWAEKYAKPLNFDEKVTLLTYFDKLGDSEVSKLYPSEKPTKPVGKVGEAIDNVGDFSTQDAKDALVNLFESEANVGTDSSAAGAGAGANS